MPLPFGNPFGWGTPPLPTLDPEATPMGETFGVQPAPPSPDFMQRLGNTLGLGLASTPIGGAFRAFGGQMPQVDPMQDTLLYDLLNRPAGAFSGAIEGLTQNPGDLGAAVTGAGAGFMDPDQFSGQDLVERAYSRAGNEPAPGEAEFAGTLIDIANLGGFVGPLEVIGLAKAIGPAARAVLRPTGKAAQLVRTAPLETVVNVPINQIKTSVVPGIETNEANVAELASDILHHGIKEPLEAVRTGGGDLVLTDGYHRLRAAERLGLDEVPIQVRPSGIAHVGGDALPESPLFLIGGGAPRSGSLPEPLSLQKLADHMFKPDMFRKLVQKVPTPLKKTLEFVHPAAFADEPFDKISAIYQADMDLGQQAANIVRLQSSTLGRHPFQVTPEGRVLGVTDKAGGKARPAIQDVFEHPTDYRLTPEAQKYISDYRAFVDNVGDLAKRYGLAFEEIDNYGFPRIIRQTPEGPVGQRPRSSIGAERGFQKERAFKTASEGIEAGYRYETDPVEALAAHAKSVYRGIADKRADGQLRLYKRTLEKGDVPFNHNDFREFRSALNKSQEGSNALARWNSELQTAQTAIDLGAAFIQGQTIMFSHPLAWTKGVGRMLQAVATPKGYARMMETAAPDVSRASSHGVSLGMGARGLTTGEALPEAIGKAKGVFENIPVLGGLYKKGNLAFAAFHDTVALNLWKALEPTAIRNGEDLQDLAQSINHMIGGMARGRTGISPSQATKESLILFASNYQRAGVALLADLGRGGMRGNEARKALGSWMAAGTAAVYGLNRLSGMEHEEALARVNPADRNWNKVRVGDANIGLGGNVTSIVRTIGRIGKTAIENPGDFKNLDPEKNPITRFLRGKTSAAFSFGIDVTFGENYRGDPETIVGAAGKRVLPFWAQESFTDPDLPLGARLAEGVGLSATSEDPVYRGRDTAAKAVFGVVFEELPPAMQKSLLTLRPDLAKPKSKFTGQIDKSRQVEAANWVMGQVRPEVRTVMESDNEGVVKSLDLTFQVSDDTRERYQVLATEALNAVIGPNAEALAKLPDGIRGKQIVKLRDQAMKLARAYLERELTAAFQEKVRAAETAAP